MKLFSRYHFQLESKIKGESQMFRTDAINNNKRNYEIYLSIFTIGDETFGVKVIIRKLSDFTSKKCIKSKLD